MRHSFFLILMAAISITACTSNTTLSSPDGKITSTFSINEEGVPQYQLTAYGQEIISNSPIGMEAEECEIGKG